MVINAQFLIVASFFEKRPPSSSVVWLSINLHEMFWSEEKMREFILTNLISTKRLKVMKPSLKAGFYFQ